MTFLTSPKRFHGHIGEIQSRAIRSWLAAAPGSRVIVYGSHPDDQAAIEACGATSVPADDPSRLPRFPEIVAYGERDEPGILTYLNCDILLLPTFPKAVEACRRRFKRFLMIGQRLDLAKGIAPNEPTDHWSWDPVQLVRDGKASLHPPAGSDYFAFPSGALAGIADLVIGRAGYDNAIIAHCLRRGIPIVDASLTTLAYHQFHDYGHVSGGANEVFHGENATTNRLHIGSNAAPDLIDASYRIHPLSGIVRNHARGDRIREAEYFARQRLNSDALGELLRKAGRAFDRLGWSQSQEWSIRDIAPCSDRGEQ